MPVPSIRPFEAVAKDAVGNFHGQQVVYFGWDKHLMFYAPVAKMLPPTMRFGEVIDTVLPATYARHPDFARIDWTAARWLKDGRPFAPDRDKSLVDNGITHKTAIHFTTPGLDGIGGSGF